MCCLLLCVYRCVLIYTRTYIYKHTHTHTHTRARALYTRDEGERSETTTAHTAVRTNNTRDATAISRSRSQPRSRDLSTLYTQPTTSSSSSSRLCVFPRRADGRRDPPTRPFSRSVCVCVCVYCSPARGEIDDVFSKGEREEEVY